MPLRITHRRKEEMPTPSGSGKVNQDLIVLKSEMSKLGAGMVLEIETGSEQTVRGTKMLITKAANQLGNRWKHWNVGSTVFARPMEEIRRRGRKPKAT
jgi:hypothetical protein